MRIRAVLVLACVGSLAVGCGKASKEERLAAAVERVRSGVSGTIDAREFSVCRDADLERFKELNTLECLNLDHCPITDVGLRNLENLPQLRELSLSRTRITDVGLKSIATLPRLEQLRLDETRITNKGIDYLKRMTSLRDLSLWRSTDQRRGTCGHQQNAEPRTPESG